MAEYEKTRNWEKENKMVPPSAKKEIKHQR
jgi:hypothetical protein